MVRLMDGLTRIRNGMKCGKLEVVIGGSRFIRNVLECLLREGYIRGYVEEGKLLRVYLKYYGSQSVITEIKFVSKPSLRVYKSYSDLRREALKGKFYVVTSSRGIFLTRSAALVPFGVGGEVLFLIS